MKSYFFCHKIKGKNVIQLTQADYGNHLYILKKNCYLIEARKTMILFLKNSFIFFPLTNKHAMLIIW